MMNKLEQIEKLRERAQVTYDEAREAYEQANEDLLDALIILERQGKVRPPQGDGYYRSEQQSAQPEIQGQGQRQEYFHRDREQDQKQENAQEGNFKETLGKIWKGFTELVNKGNTTSFEILREKEHVASFPVTVLVLLLLFAPWITIPLIVIGLFFDFHYKFVGNDN